MSRIMQAVADTISQKPEVGIFSSMVGVALSPVAIISLLSAVFGLIVTIITLVIKVMDITTKVKCKRAGLISGGEEVIIDNKRYKLVPDADDE